MFKKLLLISIPLATILGILAYLLTAYPQTSVLKSSYYFMNHMLRPHANLDKHVMGFLPYWRVEDITYVRPEMLSEINYFGLTVGSDGQLLKVINNESDPGWREWDTDEMRDFITQTRIHGTDFSVTIINQKNDVIEAFLDSPAAQKTLVSEIIGLVKENHLSGVNIDFEYLGEADEAYKHKFTSFSKLLNEEVNKELPKTELTLSIMPRAARAADLFDFPQIAPYYDRFIGMSYDYYGASSDVAGPVAPMSGFKENKFFFDVETTYEDYLKVIPREKIIMGVPYYGWEYAVEDAKTMQSTTLPDNDPDSYAAVMSYGRLRETKDIKKNQCRWDEYAQSTWCWFMKDNVGHQIWIEDEKSLGIKYDFANKNNLAGIGIWVLGFDKNYPNLWELIREKFVR